MNIINKIPNLISVLGLVIVSLITSCQGQITATKSSTIVVDQPFEQNRQIRQYHLLAKVFIAIDQSASMNNNKTAKVTLSDLSDLTSTMVQNGGSFALAAICEDSNRPLTRATFNSPQEFSQAIPPIKPDPEKVNPLDYPRLKQKYDQEMASIQASESQVEAMENDRKSQNQTKLNDIKPAMEETLKRDWNCNGTDIDNAIARANIFFQEDAIGQSYDQKYALFITDGEDTNSSQAPKIESSINVILVSGNNIGIFSAIQHQRFESPQEAINYIVNQIRSEQGGN